MNIVLIYCSKRGLIMPCTTRSFSGTTHTCWLLYQRKFPVCNFQKPDARYIIPYKFNVSYSGLTKTMEMTTILDIMGRVINTEIRNCVLSVHYMQCHESIVPAYSMSEMIKSIHNKYSKQTEKKTKLFLVQLNSSE